MDAGLNSQLVVGYTLGEQSSGVRPDVALGAGEDPNLVDVTFTLPFFRHLNNPLELGVDVVVAQTYCVDDDVQHEELQSTKARRISYVNR